MIKSENIQRKDFRFEVCANSVESCLQAQAGGADRVELCAGIPEGGTTPSFGEIKQARQVLNIKLHVIIRPRGGDFLYSPLELERMELDIDMARQLGADGVVFGCLTPDGDVDTKACQLLLDRAQGMSTTFHRAFDCCKNAQKAMKQLIDMGFDRILTSGQQPTADKGTELLKQLHEQAKGRIILLAGCGVNEKNIASIYQQTHIHEYHFSARNTFPSGMTYRNRDIYMGNADTDEYSRLLTSAAKVRRTIEALIVL